MTKMTMAALVLASSAGMAFAGDPTKEQGGWNPAGIPVIYADGSGGFRSGGLVNFDFAAAESWDAQGDSSNEVHVINVTETTPLTDITWRGTISTIGFSWRSEAAILFNTPNPAQSFILRMGSADSSSGTSTYTGSADIVAALGFAIDGAGTWTLEFYETFDDVSDAVDANWSGIDIALIPAPGSAALLGLGALVAGRRRR